MSSRQFVAGLCSMFALGLAGCTESSDTDAVELVAAAPEAKPRTAVAAIGAEPYTYTPRKKSTSVEAEEAPAVVPGKESTRIVAPQNARRPEIIAHIKQFSNNTIKFNGPYVEYSSDGTKKHAEGMFKDDLRDGLWKYYHPNGQLAKEVNYSAGKLDGQWTLYDEDGSKKFDVSYKGGMRDGQWSYYTKPDEAGKQSVVTTEEWKDGARDGRFVQFHPNGQEAREMTFKENKVSGKETRWYPSGKKYSEAGYEDGLPHGTLTIWDENGKVVVERQYDKGKPLGTAKKS